MEILVTDLTPPGSTGLITPRFVTVKETRRILNLSHGSVYKLLRNGKIKAVKHGGKTLINYESVNDYVDSLPAYVSAA